MRWSRAGESESLRHGPSGLYLSPGSGLTSLLPVLPRYKEAMTSGCPPARSLLLPRLPHHAGLHLSTGHQLNKSLLH